MENRRMYKVSCSVGYAMLTFLFLMSLFSVILEMLEEDSVHGQILKALMFVGSLLSAVLLLRKEDLLPATGIRWTAVRVLRTVLTLPVFELIFLSASLIWSGLIAKGDSAADVFPSEGKNLFFLIFTEVFLSALLEEILFRGLILPVFLPFGERTAVALSALLFAFAHWSLIRAVPAFISGLMLGGIYLVTGSIWICIGYHLFNNVCALFLSYLSSGEAPEMIRTFLWSGAALGLICLVCLVFTYDGKKLRGIEAGKEQYRLRDLFSPPMTAAFILYLVQLTVNFNG